PCIDRGPGGRFAHHVVCRRESVARPRHSVSQRLWIALRPGHDSVLRDAAGVHWHLRRDSFSRGLFNIGAEGQLMLGALAAAAVGALWPKCPVLLAPLIATAGM